ncbi:unnamed protein product, partial [Chrysoparadoxa australica]
LREEVKELLQRHPGWSTWQAKAEVLHAHSMADQLPSREEVMLALRVEKARRLFGQRGYLQADLSGLCSVTVTIVGPGEEKGAAPTSSTGTERVARHIIEQISERHTKLLQGGITHSVLKGWYTTDGRAQVFDEWERYWCQVLSPVFFRRSAVKKVISKREARARRKLMSLEAQAAHSAGSHRGEKQVNLSAVAQLERAEIAYQELMKTGLHNGRMTPEQLRASRRRDRAKKKVLLRRAMDAKRLKGEDKPAPCPYSRIPA